ncbi:hypothetical protein EB796_013371 [Bugula neritina]|uniref:Uncharacterized protein n=1 Tax=Bugula neritina TaxID=10212 RepID=A0A7J7JPR1_BUGNE|nr:hypothetical protein EB796_013371 [Bugula neritina]
MYSCACVPKWLCGHPECTSRYSSKAGCSQYQRHAHTEWYSQKVGREQEVVEECKNRTVWERDELVELAHDWVELELAYPVKTKLYRALHERHPNRSPEAIRARARYENFNQMLDDARLARDTNSVGASTCYNTAKLLSRHVSNYM